MDDLDPFGSYFFTLSIKEEGGGLREVAHFLECAGLKTAAEVFEIEEGGLNGRSHKRVGQSRWENIVLKYASSPSTYMLEWRDRFLQDQFTTGLRTKFSGHITIQNNAGTTVRRYTFEHAWPVSWEGPSFSADGSALAVETLEIAHQGLKISNE